MPKDFEVNFSDDYNPLSNREAEKSRRMATHTQRKREQGPGPEHKGTQDRQYANGAKLVNLGQEYMGFIFQPPLFLLI